jgi:hypothetical protein
MSIDELWDFVAPGQIILRIFESRGSTTVSPQTNQSVFGIQAGGSESAYAAWFSTNGRHGEIGRGVCAAASLLHRTFLTCNVRPIYR